MKGAGKKREGEDRGRKRREPVITECLQLARHFLPGNSRNPYRIPAKASVSSYIFT